MKMYVGRGPKEYIFLDNFFVAEAGTDFIIEKGQRHKCVFFSGWKTRMEGVVSGTKGGAHEGSEAGSGGDI